MMRSLRAILALIAVILGLGAQSHTCFAARAEDAGVLDVRVADHPDGTTRFVLELTQAIPFTIEAAEGGFAIDTPPLDWRSRAAGLVRPVGLVNGFTYATPKFGGGRITLFTVPAATVERAFLVPTEEGGSYRLVVDLGLGPVRITPPPVPSNDNPLLGRGPSAAQAALASADPPPEAKLKSEPAAVEVPPPLRKQDRGKPIVMLDPGHGGIDPGTTGISGEYEKDIVLALAVAVKDKLDRDGKVRCLLTRDDDTFVPLPERVARARAAKADLFMSLHADSEADPAIRGLSVYTLSKTASDATAQALADKENKADLVAGLDLANANPEVTNILIDLVQRETLNLSAVFAGLIIDEAGRETHILEYNSHRFAGFAVLKAPDVPSVLVETGYLSNRQDEQLLRRPEYRAKLAGALAKAIERYFARNREARRG